MDGKGIGEWAEEYRKNLSNRKLYEPIHRKWGKKGHIVVVSPSIVHLYLVNGLYSIVLQNVIVYLRMCFVCFCVILFVCNHINVCECNSKRQIKNRERHRDWPPLMIGLKQKQTRFCNISGGFSRKYVLLNCFIWLRLQKWRIQQLNSKFRLKWHCYPTQNMMTSHEMAAEAMWILICKRASNI